LPHLRPPCNKTPTPTARPHLRAPPRRYRQTSAVPASYFGAAVSIIEADGVQGLLLRGLGTKAPPSRPWNVSEHAHARQCTPVMHSSDTLLGLIILTFRPSPLRPAPQVLANGVHPFARPHPLAARCSPTVFRPCCSRCSGRRSTARSPGGGPPWPRAKPPRHACKQPAAPPGRLLRGKETAVDHRGVFGRAWPPAHAHQMGCCWGLSGTVRGHIVQRDAACTLFVLYTHRTVIAHLSRRSHVA